MECSYPDLLSAHNAIRGKAHLGLLTVDTRLQEIAQAHAERMAGHQTLKHQKLDGYLRRYGWHTAGENIAEGQKDVEQVMFSWMHSKGHKANILNRRYTLIGFGSAESENGNIYWCVDFAGE